MFCSFSFSSNAPLVTTLTVLLPGFLIPRMVIHLSLIHILQNREFVLGPMFEIAPHKRHPVLKKTMTEMLVKLKGKMCIRDRIYIKLENHSQTGNCLLFSYLISPLKNGFYRTIIVNVLTVIVNPYALFFVQKK